ncbi:MAG TPA: hypothetical protein VN947_30385 [Polyangia bacterium]|nr:hypothetical protein [Polyangia bacterium]
MKLIAITSILVAAGCGAQPGDPTSGIYQLTETRSGDCRTQQPDDTVVAKLVADTPAQLGLQLSPGWYGDPGASRGPVLIDEPLASGPSVRDYQYCEGVLDHRVITVESATSDHLHARLVETFSNVAAASADALCPMGAAPVADCMQTTELDYVLVQPCPSRCIEAQDAPPSTVPGTNPNQPPILRCSC